LLRVTRPPAHTCIMRIRACVTRVYNIRTRARVRIRVMKAKRLPIHAHVRVNINRIQERSSACNVYSRWCRGL